MKSEGMEEQLAHIMLEDENLERFVRFSHNAMNTVFEIFAAHENTRYAQQASAEAFREIDRLERDFSRFIDNSDISRINALERDRTTTVGLDTFECLLRSVELYRETNGLFDITLGSGFHLLELERSEKTITLRGDFITVDLGGIGKGYALDVVAALLREWEINTALVHGGRSTALSLAGPTGEEGGWPLSLRIPATGTEITRTALQHRALSGSGLQKGGHMIDPRTKLAAKGGLAAWALAPDGTTSDALSTAFLIMQSDEIERYCAAHPEIAALLVAGEKGGEETIVQFGEW